MIRKEPPHSEDLPYRASSSSTSPHVGDNGGTKRLEEESEYEVFLSFRGEDTRKGFTGHLYTSLVDAGIRAYRDNDELRVGDEIGTELLRSITQSKISIPIISEDYASSKWCLQELAQMLKCRKSGEQVVLPIFYKVKPSQVRDPKGKFGDAINAHKKNLGQEVVKEWEEALNEVSSLKGWESEKIDDGYEATLVKMVGIRVMGELKRLFDLSVPEQLVGTDDSVEQIMSKIDANFNGTWIIGIHGMGGIGKTTLAKVLYNKLFSNFENRSFVADIRERSQRNGIVCLQNELISNVIRGSEVSNVDDGIRVLKSRCKSKKVLALLDDMDDTTHLDALVGDGSWFKVGSIVIITTRNKSILDKVRASHLYELEQLPPNQSLILFSRHAFRNDFPSSDYKHISHDIVSITGGLPLALEVIGSCLCGKTKATWKDTSEKLKKIPAKEVQERLKISYDALDYEEQQIFLDIACFFIGISKQNPTYMWDACGFYPGKGIEVLSLMSLIKIGEYGELMMHDQLRDLGREIVRLENRKEPGERSRLWIDEETKNVLESNKGTCEIEALLLGHYSPLSFDRIRHEGDYGWRSCNQKSYRGEQFDKLTNLRFLLVKDIKFTGDFQNSLAQLRWLQWRGCTLDFEVVNFHPKKLAMLDLSSSNISEDWGGWGPLKMATELKVLNLSNCCNLRRTPDLSAFKSLEILNLKMCFNLKEIHHSICYIETLVHLNLPYCSKLEKLPARVGRMEESRELLCYDKPAQLLKSIGSFKSLTKLYLSNTSIKELPEFIGSMEALETLIIVGCQLLYHIPNSIGNLASLSVFYINNSPLREIPDSIGKLQSLVELDLSRTRITKLPESIGNLQNLRELNIKTTPMTELPESIGNLQSLVELDLSRTRITKLPESIGNLQNLRELNIESIAVTELPESIGNLQSLVELDLSRTQITKLPESLGNLQNLRELNIKTTPVTELPSAIGKLAKLYRLKASYGRLEGLPSSIGELVSLNELHLEGSGIRGLPEGISKLSSLRLLNVRNCKNLQEVPEPFFSLTALERPLLIRDRDYPAIRVRKDTKWRLDDWLLTTSSGTPSSRNIKRRRRLSL
ncbi:disease resistance protein RUN1-like [Eucalyptus grandis]|uniref:disease resistance protein RUN1-like n=1 Tax=Eucalyptus grandis TaxID=71139 RepID=UPI00192F0297|nr:disease resistance protein RUN1-like [Eucalyptus grandis]